MLTTEALLGGVPPFLSASSWKYANQHGTCSSELPLYPSVTLDVSLAARPALLLGASLGLFSWSGKTQMA